METNIENLKKSPLFNLSLASKELFHSNFWAWLFEQTRNTTSDFFSKQLNRNFGKLIKVDREEQRKIKKNDKEKTVNFDIYLKFENNNNIIIENKIKSIPDIYQLEEYTKATYQNNKNEILFLLSPYKPENLMGYKHIEYRKLLDFFHEKINKNKMSDYYKALYNDYYDFMKILLDLIEDWENMKIFNFHSKYNDKKNDYNKFKELRLHDLYHKFKYFRLREELDKKAREIIPNKYHSRLFNHDYFSNSTGAANLEFHLEEKKGDKDEIKRIELQVQDNLVRLILVSKNTATEKGKEKILKDNTIVGLFNSFIHNDKLKNITCDKVYPKNNGFNKYGDNRIYRARKIKEEKTSNIVESLVETFNDTIQYFDENEKGILDKLEKI
jgi:hypothetical protein